MELPSVSFLLNSLFTVARVKYGAKMEAWVLLSYRLSSRFNLLAAVQSIQREGDLDILLRCLEDEFDPNKVADGMDFSTHYQMMFSETWVVGCYEILRAFLQRDREATTVGNPTSGVSEMDEFKSIFADLELLRMPIAKFEIAKFTKTMHPLDMHHAGVEETKPNSPYDSKDPARSHIMPRRLSYRGSVEWCAIDVRNLRQHWIERRDLADRLLSLLDSAEVTGELVAKQNAAAQASTGAQQ